MHLRFWEADDFVDIRNSEVWDYIGNFLRAVGEVFSFLWSLLWDILEPLPWIISVLPYVILTTAIAGILFSHARAILQNRNEWLKCPSNNLMYSYFTHSGTHRANIVCSSAHRQIREIWGISHLAHLLGNVKHSSHLINLLLSVIYIPLMVLGLIEVALRVVIGSIYLIVMKITHRIVMFATRIFSLALIIVGQLVDRFMRRKQHCAVCYSTYALPVFLCPKCNEEHRGSLTPSECGILFARCSCNEKFLPAMALTGRSRLNSRCPNENCKGKLPAANARQVFIQLVGGADSGRGEYIQAFGMSTALAKIRKKTDAEPSAFPYYWSHRRDNSRSAFKDVLTIFDSTDEAATAGEYSKNPLHFDFCNGFILFVNTNSSREDAQDDFGVVVNQLILKLSEIKGTGREKVPVPVAIVISNGVGTKQYLIDNGYRNVIENIDATFTNVEYFPMHTRNLSPVKWILGQSKSPLAKFFKED